MTRALNRLTAAQAKSAPPGKYCDGGGLWLHKRRDGGAQWVLRVGIHNRRRELGLGSYPTVSIKEAREEAARWRAVARKGLDPKKERQRLRREAARDMHLLEDVALQAFEARKAELKGDGTAGRWFSPLELHILPKLGRTPVAEIDQIDIKDTLAPIWHDKADTARKALNRLSIIIRFAAAQDLDVDIQATDKAKELLGKQRHKAKHIPSMHWRDVPEFYASLSEPSPTHLALRFLILTAVRSYPLRHMRYDQVADGVWTIPAEAMKGRRDATQDFRVPLGQETFNVLEAARPLSRKGFVFTNPNRGVISDATMSVYMKRRGLEARPHGFRSSFRDWVAERKNVPFEVAEACLSHTVGGAVERAYRRTDYLDQRREVMGAWAAYVTSHRDNSTK